MTVTAKSTGTARSAADQGAGTRRTSKRGVNAFPKSARLLKHADFQHVYETGRKQFSASMIFFYLLKDDAPSLSAPFADRVGSQVQVGITVGRVLGGAIDRNRIKRRVRDVVRHHLAALKDALSARGISAEIVINPKKSVLTADIAALRTEVERGFGIVAAASIQKTGDIRRK